MYSAQKLHGVLDVHCDVLHDAQISQNVEGLISQIDLCFLDEEGFFETRFVSWDPAIFVWVCGKMRKSV